MKFNNLFNFKKSLNMCVLNVFYFEQTTYSMHLFRSSAKKIDPKIQRALFIFAVSNSCVNPIVYGKFLFADFYNSGQKRQ